MTIDEYAIQLLNIMSATGGFRARTARVSLGIASKKLNEVITFLLDNVYIVYIEKDLYRITKEGYDYMKRQ